MPPFSLRHILVLFIPILILTLTLVLLLILILLQALESYDFGDAGRQIYEFLWDEYADWYIELSKARMRVRSCAHTHTHTYSTRYNGCYCSSK